MQGVKSYLWKNIILTLAVAVALVVGIFMQIFNFKPISNTANVLVNFVLRMFGQEIENLDQWGKFGCQFFGLTIMVRAIIIRS